MLQAFRSAFLIPELRRRLLFTVGMLVLYRLGSFITNPGVDIARVKEFLNANVQGNALGLVNLFSGGNFDQFSIFALGIMPYITSTIIMQLLVTVVPALEKLQKEGPEGQKMLQQYGRVGGIVLGAIQGLFLAITFLSSNDGQFLLPGWTPGPVFWMTVVFTQVAGIALVLWMAERITEYGIGNGTSMIIFGGIVASWLQQIINSFQVAATGATKLGLLGLLLFFVAVIFSLALMVLMQQAERRIPVQYARKQVGRKVMGGQSTYLPIKLNAAGVIPIIFAAAILQIPAFLLSAFPQNPTAQSLASFFNPTNFSGLIIQIALIIAFTYVYTAVQFDPKRISENLRESGGFIPGIRPGEPTSKFLEHIVSRLTLWGAIFLGLIAALPYILQRLTGVTTLTYHFSGISLLIVVGVALDTLRQIESQLQMRNYDGFLTKGRIKGRFGR